MGGLITAVIGIISLPWKLYDYVGTYIFTWLVGYGSLLAAFAGVMIVDYGSCGRRVLDVVELYRPGAGGRYWFSERLQRARAGGGRDRRGPGDPGLPATPRRRRAAWSPTRTFLDQLYRYGVFVAFGLAAISYYLHGADRAERGEVARGGGGGLRLVTWNVAGRVAARPSRPRSSPRATPTSSRSKR